MKTLGRWDHGPAQMSEAASCTDYNELIFTFRIAHAWAYRLLTDITSYISGMNILTITISGKQQHSVLQSKLVKVRSADYYGHRSWRGSQSYNTAYGVLSSILRLYFWHAIICSYKILDRAIKSCTTTKTSVWSPTSGILIMEVLSLLCSLFSPIKMLQYAPTCIK